MASTTTAFARDRWKRVEELEKYAAQHGTSISSLVESHATLSKRVDNLETISQVRAIAEAREDERDKALYDRLDRIERSIDRTEKDVEGIRGIGAKALWTFIAAFIVAFAAFIIKGGLS